MKVVLQRVSSASVTVDDAVVGKIGRGLLVLVGIANGDGSAEVKRLADKSAGLRIFPNDDDGKMNRSVVDIGGEVLAVSQFTLLADCSRGKRPSFTGAAEPSIANELYMQYCDNLRQHSLRVQTGIFAADMKVSLVNDGPVTIILES